MSAFRYFSITDFSFEGPLLPLHAATTSKDAKDSDSPSSELNIPYTVFEVLVAIVSIIGNVLVIIVFRRERKLRRRTNYYIVSLAMADLLVGALGIPFAILASMGLPRNLHACLFTVSLLVVLCTISIFCLVAVSVDRYWAILYPMAYSRNVRTRTAICKYIWGYICIVYTIKSVGTKWYAKTHFKGPVFWFHLLVRIFVKLFRLYVGHCLVLCLCCRDANDSGWLIYSTLCFIPAIDHV